MLLEAQWIKTVAQTAGCDACGIAAAAPIPPDGWHLREWLSHNCHAGMRYMEEHVEMRYDPTLLLPGAKTVISILVGHKPSSQIHGEKRIAQYAYGEDYHQRLKRILYVLLSHLKERYPELEARPFVDTAPISDKYWAVQAGLGWWGKNTLLINPTFGSYCHIGELVTTAAADKYDKPVPNGCGSCGRCIHACPNQAICSAASHTWVDARQCASFHTIENRSETLPPHIRLSGYAFGCDCCQLVCPFNQQSPVRYELPDARRQELEALPHADEKTFKKATRHSAINRIRYTQWIRNLQHGDND